jgi:hypothetical protein
MALADSPLSCVADIDEGQEPLDKVRSTEPGPPLERAATSSASPPLKVHEHMGFHHDPFTKQTGTRVGTFYRKNGTKSDLVGQKLKKKSLT